MPDIMDLIAEILDNPKLKNVASKIQSEYHDEPILRTAAQMARRLPKPLADAKKLAQRPNQYHYSYNELFLRQAKRWRTSPTTHPKAQISSPTTPPTGT